MRRALLYQVGSRDAAHFARLVEAVQLAEQLGITRVWCLPEAGERGDFRLGAPEFWLAGLAAQTERIRLGWGIAGLMPPERPPIRTAEQAASLDIACEGRLDVALLPSTQEESAAVGDDSWLEGVRMLVDMWDQPRFSWTSPRFEVPPVDVVPKPVQKPHPPLWSVGWSEAHARQAGAAGMGFLDVSGAGDGALEVHRDAYTSARAGADPNELVCVSAYAAAYSGARPTEMLERLDAWAERGFDEAVLRIDAEAEEAKSTRGRIRLLAGGAAQEH